MGIGTMTREEKAVIYVTNQYLTESPLMSMVGLEEVQFEVELIHFTQVRNFLIDGEQSISLRIIVLIICNFRLLCFYFVGFGVFPTKVLVIGNLLYFLRSSSINVYCLGIPVAHDIFVFGAHTGPRIIYLLREPF